MDISDIILKKIAEIKKSKDKKELSSLWKIYRQGGQERKANKEYRKKTPNYVEVCKVFKSV